MDHNLSSAISLLKEYSTLTPKKVETETQIEQLRSAVKLVVSLATAQNFGICASNVSEASSALVSYLQSLKCDLELPANIATITTNNTPTYLKFSTQRMSFNIERYDGNDRGVLITIFSDDQEEIVGTYGYLPLDLFEDK